MLYNSEIRVLVKKAAEKFRRYTDLYTEGTFVGYEYYNITPTIIISA